MLTTFQINLSPSDYKLVASLLPHQLKVWRDQVDEVLIVVDTHRSAGRFSDGWEEGYAALFAYLDTVKDAEISIVNYGNDASERISASWLGGGHVPLKDFRGGPCYSYFYGLTQAQGRYVIHSDADMFFGGLSRTWVAEAINAYEENRDVLFLAPLSGPPCPSGSIHTLSCTPDGGIAGGQRFDFMSTRLFMIDKKRFAERIKSFTPRRPTRVRESLKALIEANSCWDLPEHWMTKAMLEAGMYRLEFPGSEAGLWSLHPPYRCASFYESLPRLIEIVEAGILPDAQLGCHDFNESLVDWSEAILRLKSNRWWLRLLARLFAISPSNSH